MLRRHLRKAFDYLYARAYDPDSHPGLTHKEVEAMGLLLTKTPEPALAGVVRRLVFALIHYRVNLCPADSPSDKAAIEALDETASARKELGL